MPGFFTSLFGGGSNNTRRTRAPLVPGTDARKRTPNAEETGRKAIPRPSSTPAPIPATPPTPTLVPDPLTQAHLAARRQLKRGRSQRASALLGGRASSQASLAARTLIGS